VLTQTTELGVSVLLYLGLEAKDRGAVTPRQIAEFINTSPTYTAKVCGQLVKADILRSQRGAAGGVTLSRKPSELTLLEIVEACQGRVLPDYCEPVKDMRQVCAYHAAMADLYGVITGVLKAWTLQDLLARPRPSKTPAIEGHCLITKQWKGLDAYLEGKPAPSVPPKKRD
jgi:Rrf2 family nitric oxide-sensitive transcriptional repressor